MRHIFEKNIVLNQKFTKFIYKYTIEIFFSLTLFRLRNVCLISIPINRLFEPTYRMYEPLISI